MGWKATTGPSEEPLNLAKVKTHLRVTHTSEDSLIRDMITAAREEVEKYCNISLIEQTITEVFNCFPEYRPENPNANLWLSVSPLISIESINYTDTDGQDQTLSTDVYISDIYSQPGKAILKHEQVWETTASIENAITIVYKAGFGTNAASVPQSIKHAMLLMIGNWYEKRQDDPQTPFSRKVGNAQWLLDKHRVYYFV